MLLNFKQLKQVYMLFLWLINFFTLSKFADFTKLNWRKKSFFKIYPDEYDHVKSKLCIYFYTNIEQLSKLKKIQKIEAYLSISKHLYYYNIS